MSDFFELLIKRRAIRDFEDKDVPLETIRQIIKDSCLAPSSGNGQPWKFVVVTNRNLIKRLSDESKSNILSYLEKNPNAYIKKYETTLRDKNFNVFYNAPALVYIAGIRSIASLDVDCALAACYFMLSAASRGLGTCWINLGSNIRDADICEEIGLPEDCRIVAPIIVGYPKAIPAPPPRNDPQILKVTA